MSENCPEFKDFDRAFIQKLKGLKLEDEEGELREVPVSFINPQDVYPSPNKKSLPCIVVFRNGAYPDFYGWRYDNSTYYTDITYDEKGNPLKGKAVKATEPYNIYYGIRVYYKLQGDGASLNFYVNKKLHRGAYLTIGKESYDIDFLSYKNPEGTYRTFGQKDLKEPEVWVDQYLFKVEADLVMDDTTEEAKFSQKLESRLKI